MFQPVVSVYPHPHEDGTQATGNIILQPPHCLLPSCRLRPSHTERSAAGSRSEAGHSPPSELQPPSPPPRLCLEPFWVCRWSCSWQSSPSLLGLHLGQLANLLSYSEVRLPLPVRGEMVLLLPPERSPSQAVGSPRSASAAFRPRANASQPCHGVLWARSPLEVPEGMAWVARTVRATNLSLPGPPDAKSRGCPQPTQRSWILVILGPSMPRGQSAGVSEGAADRGTVFFFLPYLLRAALPPVLLLYQMWSDEILSV